MPERKVPRLVRQAAAVAAVVALAFPPGTVAALTWLANHDMVDVPYVRDCHGLFRHPQECRRAEAAGP